MNIENDSEINGTNAVFIGSTCQKNKKKEKKTKCESQEEYTIFHNFVLINFKYVSL